MAKSGVIGRVCLWVVAAASLAGPGAWAKVLAVNAGAAEPVLGGKPFGDAGAYVWIQGEILFGFDPANPANDRIVDIERAPRNRDGLVEARANFALLKPADPAKSSGVLLVEVSNRGGKFSLRYFNRARARFAVDNEAAFGDGLMMRAGMSVLWVGWQFDTPEFDGALRLTAPIASRLDGSPILGWVRSDWTVDDAARSLPLSHRNHKAYLPVEPDSAAHRLTVRDDRDASRRLIPRDQWWFRRWSEDRWLDDPSHVALDGGFQAGKIYELTYRAKDPAVVGLGLAVIRDVAAYSKRHPDALFPAAHCLAAGVSQTGRFLRHFLYQGFNTDESGRQAYDGLMIITAGAGRGSFNHRFAQPSRDGHGYSAFFYPTDIFPFTGATQSDPGRGGSDGLLARQDPRHLPKIFYINTGYEYWGRAASLIHTSVDGARDIEPGPRERIYLLASGQHFVDRFPPRPERRLGEADAYRGNPLDFSVNYRALLVRLVRWAVEGREPPASAYPRIDKRTLAAPADVAFPAVPGLTKPKTPHTAYRADYGPRWAEGIVDLQPPTLGPTYPILVAQVDELGNELAGVRNVELRVPLATYTPWSLRAGFAGGADKLFDFRGVFAPLPVDEAARQSRGDPRPSAAALYPSREAYLAKVRAAASALVAEGFLLDEDREYVAGRALSYWDWLHQRDAAPQ